MTMDYCMDCDFLGEWCEAHKYLRRPDGSVYGIRGGRPQPDCPDHGRATHTVTGIRGQVCDMCGTVVDEAIR